MARNWSPESRERMRRLIMARKPWEQSTGPRSQEGKAKLSLNAYKGALRPAARELIRQIRRCEEFARDIDRQL